VADLGGGIYVSRVESDDFLPDEEVGGFTHTLFEDGEVMAGLWKPGSDVGAWPKTEELHARETIVVLVGSVRIEIKDGPTLDLGVGDMASTPKGAPSRRGIRRPTSRRSGSTPGLDSGRPVARVHHAGTAMHLIGRLSNPPEPLARLL
jgi:uncharacterized cupin superfamily protein